MIPTKYFKPFIEKFFYKILLVFFRKLRIQQIGALYRIFDGKCNSSSPYYIGINPQKNVIFNNCCGNTFFEKINKYLKLITN